MGEPGVQLRRARDAAIALLDSHLVQCYGAQRQTGEWLGSRYGRFPAGWLFTLTVDGHPFEIVCLVSQAFPFEPPRLNFSDRSLFLRFPHVEKTGKICITTSAATFSPSRVVQAIDFLIAETKTLIADSVSGRNASDFTAEFQNYWLSLPSHSPKAWWSFLRPGEPTREVSCYIGSRFTLFAESSDAIRAWLKQFGGGAVPKPLNVRRSLLVWLPQPPSLQSPPRTGRDLLGLIRSTSESVDSLLFSVIPKDNESLPIVLGFDAPKGPVLAGAVVSEPLSAPPHLRGEQRHSRHDGFRAEKLPPNLLVPRYFSDRPLALTSVSRVDPAWCLQRGGAGFVPPLLRKRVAIVGCGSLGADVAMMLAKSGVGEFVLIDNDVLGWDNAGRHLLGGEFAGKSKPDALAAFLGRQLPWLSITANAHALETLIYETPKLLQKCDLIISTTGDWTSDCLLNAAARTIPRFPAVLFGWTEPFGFAGHALAVHTDGGCLACGMNEFGVFNRRVTYWPDGAQPLVQAAGCGDLFQPYGVVDTTPIKSFIAQAAIQILRGELNQSRLRTWIGELAGLEATGGRVTEAWQETLRAGETDLRAVTSAWPQNPQCPLCV